MGVHVMTYRILATLPDGTPVIEPQGWQLVPRDIQLRQIKAINYLAPGSMATWGINSARDSYRAALASAPEYGESDPEELQRPIGAPYSRNKPIFAETADKYSLRGRIFRKLLDFLAK